MRINTCGCIFEYILTVLYLQSSRRCLYSDSLSRGGRFLLFNSQIFIIGFLPITLFLYYRFATYQCLREWFLIAASLFFYAYWDVRLLPLLVASVVLNWGMVRICDRIEKKYLIIPGILINLLIIGIFKYADFVVDTAGLIFSFKHDAWNIVLPLGISFFTFQQISYLVDHERGDAPAYRFRQYFLYVVFFPQLIAGPIVRHNEFIYQLGQSPNREGLEERLGRGATLFLVGLVKKVLLADMIAPISDQLFNHALSSSLATLDAWLAAIAFTFQIYFDFSGYSDMAIGLALMFGFVLPVNFNIPYRATSIQEFWRRWHITLSQFLRDYLYIPLGGNRHGSFPQMLAVLVTMLLGGLWHGAGWTFVLWGGLHGLAQVIHRWSRQFITLPSLAGWGMTMLFVILTWVLFRAEKFSQASGILRSMFAMAGDSAEVIGKYDGKPWVIAIAAVVALIGPSSQNAILERRFNKPWLAAVVGVALVVLVIQVGSKSAPEFIYFQF